MMWIPHAVPHSLTYKLSSLHKVSHRKRWQKYCRRLLKNHLRGLSLSATKELSSLMVQWVTNLPVIQEMWVWFLDLEDLWEEGMATHSSIFAWKIPWTEEPGAYSPWVTEWDTTERLSTARQRTELKKETPKNQRKYSNTLFMKRVWKTVNGNDQGYG